MKELEIDYYFKHIDEFPCKEIFEGCKYPWEVLAKTKSFLKEKVEDKNLKENNAKETGDFCIFKGNYYIGEGTKISPRVIIEGPVYIGENCTIAPGAYIRPGTIIGDKVGVRI